MRSSPAFRQSWSAHGRSLGDVRVRAVAAIAPPPPVRAFTEASITGITLPAALITGGADTEAPPAVCAGRLAAQNSRLRHHSLGTQIGHYSFLDVPAEPALHNENPVFQDAPGVCRQEVHAAALEITAGLLA